MARIDHPFHPIIYVRGYAMTPGEIEATVSTPYMGFNLGSTRIRQDWHGKVIRHIFESPLVRLMKDYGYQDIYDQGCEKAGPLPARSIIIHRYYEQGDRDFGDGDAPSVLEAARGLGELIDKLRGQVCGDDAQARAAFKVYLVAHSMGGLVVRCFLQNTAISSPEIKALVDKVFTYATPHNGIDMLGVNVPAFLGIWDINNFNRARIAAYLGLPENADRVDTLDGKFDPRRFFCLIGTNHKDYDIAAGVSRRLAGEMSDGLVNIENAAVQGAPRAFVYRSHSGAYGIVNSEDGYQNLVRFLFGDVQVNGIMEVEALPLPPSVRKAQDEGKQVRASYYFEAIVAPRGAMNYKLTERRKETHSAVLRKFDELMRVNKVAGLDAPRSPVLFSAFLDAGKITVGRALVFNIELGVSTTAYEIDGFLFLDRHVPDEQLFRNAVTIKLSATDQGWDVRYNLTDDAWSEARGRAAERDERGWYIPLQSAKGFKARLRLQTRPWNRAVDS